MFMCLCIVVCVVCVSSIASMCEICGGELFRCFGFYIVRGRRLLFHLGIGSDASWAIWFDWPRGEPLSVSFAMAHFAIDVL